MKYITYFFKELIQNQEFTQVRDSRGLLNDFW